MTTLLVLGFPYPTTADAAAQDILLQEPELAATPDAVAVVTCDDDGAFHVTTNHTLAEDGPLFFWQLLLTALVFLPGSRGLDEHDLNELSQRLEALGLDVPFQDRLREMLAPDRSALFLLATQPLPADALTALGRFGGKLLAASLSPDIEVRLTHALVRTGAFNAVLAAEKAPEAPAGPPGTVVPLPSVVPLPESPGVPGARVSPARDETSGGRRPGPH
jgi:uncharacterized membrane protein